MKNQLLVILDESAKPHIAIGKMKDVRPPASRQEYAQTVILDMATLCEAVVCLIHLAEKEGIKSSADSLRDCIKHLQHGFGDASFESRYLAQRPPEPPM